MNYSNNSLCKSNLDEFNNRSNQFLNQFFSDFDDKIDNASTLHSLDIPLIPDLSDISLILSVDLSDFDKKSLLFPHTEEDINYPGSLGNSPGLEESL
ncbi:MAG: hypothetical protein BWY64_02080 [bacterium ADurb.Bin363]|nr:MAG: hypothetical protein BWY64_02080 [bacterium ADurb.Bin363]